MMRSHNIIKAYRHCRFALLLLLVVVQLACSVFATSSSSAAPAVSADEALLTSTAIAATPTLLTTISVADTTDDAVATATDGNGTVVQVTIEAPENSTDGGATSAAANVGTDDGEAALLLAMSAALSDINTEVNTRYSTIMAGGDAKAKATLLWGSPNDAAVAHLLAPPAAVTSAAEAARRHRRLAKKRKSSSPLLLVTPERVAWEMASTAGRKHKEVFYSVDYDGAAAWGSAVEKAADARRAAAAAAAMARQQKEMSGAANANASAATAGGGESAISRLLAGWGKQTEAASAASSSSPMPTERYSGASHVPAAFLLNHIINAKSSVFMALWQLGSVVNPLVKGQTAALQQQQTGGEGKVSPAPHSITSILSCLQFTDTTPPSSAAGPNSSNALGGAVFGGGTSQSEDLKGMGTRCPEVPEQLRASHQSPQSSQVAVMWELVKESVATAYKTCEAAATEEGATTSSSAAATTHCAVGRGSELLYWVLRADDYSIGRGRIVQSSVLLEVLQEEVGGEEAPYWMAVPAAVASQQGGGAYRLVPSRRRPHPQFVGYRGLGADGHDLLVTALPVGGPLPAYPSSPAIVEANKRRYLIPHPLASVSEAFKAKYPFPLVVPRGLAAYPCAMSAHNYKLRHLVEHLLGTADHNVEHNIVNGLIMPTGAALEEGEGGGGSSSSSSSSSSGVPAPVDVSTKSANFAVPFPVNGWFSGGSPTPFGHNREEGRAALERYYYLWWDYVAKTTPSTAAAAGGGAASSSSPSTPFCAPLSMTTPKCSLLADKGSWGGRDPLHGFLSGPENRDRQIPIRLEDSWELKDKFARTIGGGEAAEKAAAEALIPRLPTAAALTTPMTLLMYLRDHRRATLGLLASIREGRRRTYADQLQQLRAMGDAAAAAAAGANSSAAPPPGSSSSSGANASSAEQPSASAIPLLEKTVIRVERRIMVTGDREHYRPYMDPRSPTYRRILCATYTYHKKNSNALQYHRASAHLCDKHLIFTDKRIPDDMLSKLDQGRYVIVALNTPGGEDYMNMWQKTRMILDKVEMMVRGYAERTAEEGANTPDHDGTRSPNDPAPSSPPRQGPPQLVAAAPSASAEEVAAQLLPHYSGYDHVLLSGDDVCLNVLKLRRYLAEAEELYGVALSVPSNRRRAGYCATARSSTLTASSAQYYRSTVVPQHIGYGHRDFISGATYVMNRQGFANFMSAGHSTCQPGIKSFAEDWLMGRCHVDEGLVYRNANAFGTSEDAFNTVGIEAVTGQTHHVAFTWWMRDYRRKAWARGPAVLSKDAVSNHFCPISEMQRGVSEAFGEQPSE